MPEPIQVAAPVDPKSTAGNIAKGISERANGKAPIDPKQNSKAPEGQVQPPIDPNAGKEKYVVDGREIWLTAEQARGYVQKGIAFEPKVTQLGHLQNETRAFLQTLAQDPLKILTDKRIGLTPDVVLDKLLSSGLINQQGAEKMGKWYYDNVITPMKMDPNERKAMEAEKRLSEYEKREQAQRDQAIQQQNEARVQQAMSRLKAEIGEAMQLSNIPLDSALGAFTARRVADVMRLGQKQGHAVTPKQAIETVKAEMKQIQRAWYDILDEDGLVQEIGEANAEKVKKHFLKLAKDQEKSKVQNGKVPSIVKRDERKTTTMDDFHDYLDDLKKKG